MFRFVFKTLLAKRSEEHFLVGKVYVTSIHPLCDHSPSWSDWLIPLISMILPARTPPVPIKRSRIISLFESTVIWSIPSGFDFILFYFPQKVFFRCLRFRSTYSHWHYVSLLDSNKDIYHPSWTSHTSILKVTSMNRGWNGRANQCHGKLWYVFFNSQSSLTGLFACGQVLSVHYWRQRIILHYFDWEMVRDLSQKCESFEWRGNRI